MRTVKLGRLQRTEIKLYQDIDETPIEQYNLFNEYSLRDCEIGNTMQDVDKKYSTLLNLIHSKQNEKAVTELHNLYQTHWSMMNRINYKSLQFGCLLHSIDGQAVQDYSEDNLKHILGWLSRNGLTMKLVKEEVETVKKNFKLSWN